MQPAGPPPITDDVDGFSRVLINAMTKSIRASGDVYTETHRRRRSCFKAYPGLEVEGSFVAQRVTKMNVRMCFFMAPDRGFELKSIVPASHEIAERPLIESILEATEVK
ncbi:MAG TPA: hypothetical protein VKU41_00910 [Polyangiaceae bacterium]|nr:hypothetical protein [Polyangiaceae bacterium]